jgi:hypothetical protein
LRITSSITQIFIEAALLQVKERPLLRIINISIHILKLYQTIKEVWIKITVSHLYKKTDNFKGFVSGEASGPLNLARYNNWVDLAEEKTFDFQLYFPLIPSSENNHYSFCKDHNFKIEQIIEIFLKKAAQLQINFIHITTKSEYGTVIGRKLKPELPFSSTSCPRSYCQTKTRFSFSCNLRRSTQEEKDLVDTYRL